MKILIKNASIITMNKNREIIHEGSILIENDKIEEVKKGNIKESFDLAIDASGKLVLPGFINGHQHISQLLLRGITYDIPFPNWDTNYVFKVGSEASKEDYYMASILACIEMLKSGTTTFIENHFWHKDPESIEAIAKAIHEFGIKGILAYGFIDQGVPEDLIVELRKSIKEFKKFYSKWNLADNGRIRVWLGPGGFGMCSKELLEEIASVSKELKANIQIHSCGTLSSVENTLWKYGKRELEFLKNLGILGPRTNIVHGIWLNLKDIELLKESKTSVTHCPISNMLLGFGIAPIPLLMKYGIKLLLGTDGLGSYTQDMYQVIRTTALLHKLSSLDPTSISALNVLEMATIGAAKAIGMDKEIGSIEPNKKADIQIVNPNKARYIPFGNAISMLVYCGYGSDVETVIVDGKVLVKDGELVEKNELEIIPKIKESINELWKKCEFIKSIKSE
ncbi:MAG: amidohydrolase [Candidatus Bathyarchaeia archaeon]